MHGKSALAEVPEFTFPATCFCQLPARRLRRAGIAYRSIAEFVGDHLNKLPLVVDRLADDSDLGVLQFGL